MHALAPVAQTAYLAQTVYLGWGAVTIQLGNFIIIVTMIVLFILALVLPFPKGRSHR